MKNARTKHIEFILGDVAALELANYIAILLRHISPDTGFMAHYWRLGGLLAVILLTVIFFTDGYRDVLRRGYLKEIIAVGKQMVLTLMIEIALLYTLELIKLYDKRVIFTGFFAGVLLIYGERILVKLFLRRRFRKIKYARTMMVIGTKEQAEIMVARLLAHPLTIFKIIGLAVVDEDMKGQKIQGVEVTSDCQDMMSFAASNIIDEVLVGIPGNPRFESEIAKQFLSIGLVVHIYMDQYFQNLPNSEQDRISDMGVMTCFNREIPLWMTVCKRLMDIAGGLVGSLMAVFIGIIIGPMIYMKSPGPILFSQIRVGKNGRKFRIYKFRSMYMDAEERKKELMSQNKIKGHMFKMDNAPRIIPGIGYFIRKTSLDEFPQFFNVLKGDMSLVGTRPPTVDEYEAYDFYHNKRLAMKPGLTGVWQISGRSDIEDFEEVVKLDSKYIDGWSIEKDIKIIFKTVLVMFTGRGSA